jgi:hypothetical protein
MSADRMTGSCESNLVGKGRFSTTHWENCTDAEGLVKVIQEGEMGFAEAHV